MSSFTPASLPDLTGRVCLVTGGNTGLGYETVLQLAIHHARVYLGSRSEEKGKEAIRRIRERVPGADIRLVKMDLKDLRSVVGAAEEVRRQEPRLHGLVNNAGIMATPYERTIDGYEAQFQTNYLSHWLLTQLLLPSILEAASTSPPGVVRIVNVSSEAHFNAPSYGINLRDVNENVGFLIGPVARYGSSKLANILHARELWRRYGSAEGREANSDSVLEGGMKASGEVWTASINPGRVDTNLLRRSYGNVVITLISMIFAALAKIFPLNQTVENGAYTQLFAIASDEFGREMSGEYLENGTQLGKVTKKAKDDELARQLWERTEKEMKRAGFI